MRWRCVVYGPGGAIGRGVIVRVRNNARLYNSDANTERFPFGRQNSLRTSKPTSTLHTGLAARTRDDPQRT